MNSIIDNYTMVPMKSIEEVTLTNARSITSTRLIVKQFSYLTKHPINVHRILWDLFKHILIF